MAKLEAKHLPRKNEHVQKLAKMLDDAAEQARRQTRQKKTFSPSSLLYGSAVCARRWYYHFDGAPSVDTTESLNFQIMNSGTDAHARIQTLLEKATVLDVAEQEITASDPPIRGFLDAKITVEDKEFVVEIKTTSQESWVFRRASMKPVDYHRLQLLIYMWILEIEDGLFIYQNRNTLEQLYIPITMNEDNKKFLEDSLEWLRSVRKAYDDRTLPRRPFKEGRNKTVCPQCPFYNYCWEVDDREGEVTLPRMQKYNGR